MTAAPSDPSTQITPARGGSVAWIRVALVLSTLFTFAPVLTADFTNWDDDANISRNPLFNPPTLATVQFYWRHAYLDLYIPVTYTAWAAIGRVAWSGEVGKLNPVFFHAANLALHVGTVLVVFEILRRLLRTSLGALAGSLLFALHPVQVEPVAWVSGLKDVLCGFLSFLAIWQYIAAVGADQQPVDHQSPEAAAPSPASLPLGQHTYIIGKAAYLLAMLAKPTALMVPIVLLAIDRLIFKREWKTVARWIFPWAILAVPCAIWTYMAQPGGPEVFRPALALRFLVAGHAMAFYLMKLVLPIRLTIDYGWTPDIALAHWPKIVWILPLALALALWIERRKIPVTAAGAMIFLTPLIPVLGLTPFDFQKYSTVADHYLYMPMLGAALISGFFIETLASRGTAFRRIAWLIAFTLAAILVALTFLQTRRWHDSESLFQHALALNPQSWVAHNNLAAEALGHGNLVKARTEAQAAIAAKQNYAPALMTLGAIDALQGDLAGALRNYRRAADLSPDDPQILGQLGGAEAQAGNLPEAEMLCRRALALNPYNSQARLNLATVLVTRQKFPEAVNLFHQILAQDDRNMQAHLNLAIALQMTGKDAEAAAEFEKVLTLDPVNARAMEGLRAINRSQK